MNCRSGILRGNRFTDTVVLSLVIILLGRFIAPVRADDQDLPAGVVNTQNPADVSLSPAQSLERITVPDGFHVTLFAGEPAIRRPIAFDFDDRGRLWVVENYAHPKWEKDNATDRVIILEDTNHDGQFDQRTVFWDKGRYLTGIAVGHGGIWLANTPELTFIPDRNGDDKPDSDPVAMLDGFQISSNNVVNNFHWGPDGWLYGAIGLASPSMVGKPGTPKAQRTRITRGIWRFHPGTHVFEKVAEGMVNPWGADFNQFGDLITANTVLAHLWHIVPGMACERRASEQDNPYAYQRVQSITNHLHWGGGQWQSSRETTERHSVAGGGHAHCGAMIYLGDNWPAKYRGTFFTNNLHGNRVNNDKLVPHGSSWVGQHSDDFLFGNDEWFRGLSIKYGPDGGVYISDWHDTGECHDKDGSHRSSGRIYKVVYGSPAHVSTDLQKLTNAQLAELQTHKNAWQARHARRILHERAMVGSDVSSAIRILKQQFATSADEELQLRALWTLRLCCRNSGANADENGEMIADDLDETALVDLLGHANQHVRRWAIRFLVDHTAPSTAAVDALARQAHLETSPKVRLALACALQRLPHKSRQQIARGLLTHSGDVYDHYLPLMIWYGIEPTVVGDPEAALQLAADSQIPLVRKFIARRLADNSPPHVQPVINAANSQSGPVRDDLLRGLLDGLKGRGRQPVPKNWDNLYTTITSANNSKARSVGVQLATLFGDRKALRSLRNQVLNQKIQPTQRRASLASLLMVESGDGLVNLLHTLVRDDKQLRGDSIQALSVHNNSATAAILLAEFAALPATQQRDVVSVLATRRTFASQLLERH